MLTDSDSRKRDAATCSKRVYRGFHGHQCKQKVSIFRDGSPYCKQHDPVAVAARRKARHAKWDAEWETERKLEKLHADIRTASDKIIAAARCIKHWHDTGNGGMIVSGEHVFALWKALERYDKLAVKLPQ